VSETGRSLYGWLLALLANIGLGWVVGKVWTDERSSLFGLFVSDNEIRFIRLRPGAILIKLFTLLFTNVRHKLECLSLASLSSLA
jgi:hypothetical protein